MDVENNIVGAGAGNLATLDEDLILDLASIGCTYNEIAEICKVNVSTLERRVRDIITEGHATMKKSVRRKQLEVAIKDGNPTMLIWLGKQCLNQRDFKGIEVTGADGGPIDHTVKIEFISNASQVIDGIATEIDEDDNDE